MNPTINLLPRSRQRDRLVRRSARRWASAVALAASLCLPIAGLMRGAVDPALRAQLSAAAAAEAESRASVAEHQSRLEALAHEERVAGLIASRPDAARLVNAIAGSVGRRVAMERLRLDRLASPDGQAQNLVTVSGLAHDQLEAQQLAVRLEALGVFRSVTLQQTQRRPSEVGDLVSFRIGAVLKGETP